MRIHKSLKTNWNRPNLPISDEQIRTVQIAFNDLKLSTDQELNKIRAGIDKMKLVTGVIFILIHLERH